MKKIVLGLAFLVILGVFAACENPSGSSDKITDGIITPVNPGSIAFSYQIVHTQQYIQGTWIGSFNYPVVTIISSRAELKQYCNDYEDMYDFSRHQYSPTGFTDAIGRYSDAFFADNFLVLVLLEETSGSNRHRLERIEENGNIVITRLVPEIGTADMAQWHIIIELGNNDKLEQYKAVFFEEKLEIL